MSSKQTWKKQSVKTVHVTFLVDRSGSMASIRDDVIGGFNQFVHEQQALEGECFLTLHQFDSGGFDTLFDAQSIKDVRKATLNDFQPRGSTPLLDSIGKTITSAATRVEAHPDEQPIVVVLTDGYENASREYKRESIRKLIAEKEAAGWVFTYIGANVDAYSESAGMGFNVAATQNFVGDKQGTYAAMDSVGGAVAGARAAAASGVSVSTADFYVKTGKGADEDWKKRVDKEKGEKK